MPKTPVIVVQTKTTKMNIDIGLISEAVVKHMLDNNVAPDDEEIDKVLKIVGCDVKRKFTDMEYDS